MYKKVEEEKMMIKVTGEHNFFLFQDIVYFFITTLNGDYCSFPIKNKHRGYEKYTSNTYSYIYDSWLAVLKEKLYKVGLTDKGSFIVSKLSDWMITTNIAITTAQIGRGRKDIPSWELEYAKKNKPYFLIEHSDDFETYVIHLDGDIKEVFLEALKFYKTFQKMSPDTIMNELISLYKLNKSDIQEEVNVIAKHFVPNIKYFDSYEVVEE